MPIFVALYRKWAPWMFVAVLSLGLRARGLADASSATIALEITDTSGALIQDADVVVRNISTNQEQQAQSGKSGLITFPFLKPALYSLTVSKQGFTEISVDNILLNVGDQRKLQLVLKVGSATQNVTVDGKGLTINTADGSVSTVIDRNFIANMPLNGRSFQDLISMAPGVTTQSPQSGSSVAYSGDFSVNGQRTESNYYVVDGVGGNVGAGNGYGGPQPASSGSLPPSTALGTTQALTSVDALQEFRVQTSSYSAEYGRTPGDSFRSLRDQARTTFTEASSNTYEITILMPMTGSIIASALPNRRYVKAILEELSGDRSGSQRSTMEETRLSSLLHMKVCD